jgi:hypothetical protein
MKSRSPKKFQEQCGLTKDSAIFGKYQPGKSKAISQLETIKQKKKRSEDSNP